MKSTAVLTGLSLLAATAQASIHDTRQKPLQLPAETPVKGALKSQGCFKSRPSDMTKSDKVVGTSLTSGSCMQACREDDTVMALSPKGCFCGKTMPPKDDKVADPQCDWACPAYGFEACGGLGPVKWSFYNLGVKLVVPEEGSSDGDDDDDDSESSSTVSSSADATETSSKTAAPSSTDASDGETSSTAEPATETESQMTGSGEAGETTESSAESKETEESGEPDMGKSLGGSVAAVAAVAGGTLWLLL